MIGDSPSLGRIFSKIKTMDPRDALKSKKFATHEEFNTYMSSVEYGANLDNPSICFGFFFRQIDQSNFNYTLNYFNFERKNQYAISDVPAIYNGLLDQFQSGPDMDSLKDWLSSGYIQMMKFINDEILYLITKNEASKIDFGVVAQKYTKYSIDKFGDFIGFLLPFFVIIGYVCPVCVIVFRMVTDKESRAKEGMKIMGLKEGTYFLSYLFHHLIFMTIYSILCSLILTRVFKNVGFIFILGFFWLYGMACFALAYFFQAVMDKTRIAIIISILVYFIMFFVSVAVLSEDVPNIAKMFMSLLPPTALQLGLQVMAKYEANFKKFHGSDVSAQYQNYSVGNMYGMLVADFILYMFLGYYFQNVLSHDFGLKRPLYFLCTKTFWCKSKKAKNSVIIDDQSGTIKINVANINNSQNENNNLNRNTQTSENFQEETKYESKTKPGEYLKIQNLKKVFDDGKVAVDGLNLNLYNGEIFALLGHNGAGKSTTISILCGLYEATGGKAIYSNMNVLEENNMNEFRKRVGICPQHDVLFDSLTVKEHLEMFCIFKGVDSQTRKIEIEKTLNDMKLKDKEETLAKNLSGGQKRKLSIAIALCGGSEVVFLDEPSSGMDITSRRNLWDILKKCVGNRIIVLTTHYMEEASVLGDRIGIVSNGKLKCRGNSLFLIDRFGKYISLNVIKQSDAKDDEIIRFVKERINNVEVEILTEEILFRILKQTPDKKDISLKKFFQDLDTNLNNLKIKSYGASMPTLEDVFLNVSSDTKQKSKIIKIIIFSSKER